jgi:O-antigen/teichoic acid export membrane protein
VDPVDPASAAVPQTTLRRELGRAAVASGTYAVADGLARAVTLALTLVYTRYLTPADYGALAITSTVMLLLTPALGLSISAAISRLWFEARSEEERRRLYGSLLAFLVVVPTAFVAAIEVAGDLDFLDVFGGAPYDPYLRYAVLTAYCSVFIDLAVSIYIVQRRPRAVLALAGCNALLTLGLSLVLVVGRGEGVIGVLRAGLVASAIVASVAVVLSLRMAGWRLRPSRHVVAACLAFSVPLIPAALAQWLLQVSDRPLLSHFVSADKVGQYYIGYSVGAIAGIAVHGASRALSPVVTRHLKDDAVERVERIGTYWFAGLVMVCLAIALFGRDLLSLLVGARFGEAPAVVPVVALAHVSFAAYVVVTQGIWFGMRTRLVPLLTFGAAVVNISLNLLLIPRFGMLAAAWDTVAGFTALALFHGVLAHRVYRISWEYARWAKIAAAAALAYGVASLAGSHPSPKRLALEVIGVTVVFPLGLSLLRFWTATERGLIARRLRLADAARPDARLRVVVVAAVWAFVAATTRWLPWEQPIRERFAADVDDYERIAVAAPHLTWPQITGHLSMWPVHYVVGVIAKVTHLPLHATYYVCAFAVLGSIVVLADRLLLALGVGPTAYVLGMSTLLLDPYVFRYLALAPGMINDGVFIAGAGLAALGLVRGRLAWVSAGVAAAAVGRGVSVPPLLVAAALCLVFIPFRAAPLWRRLVDAALVVVPAIVAVGVAYAIGKTTPGHAEAVKDCCAVTDVTVLGDLVRLPGSAGALALHLFRTAIGLAVPAALAVGAAVVLGPARLRSMPRALWQLLVLVGAMVAQPLLISSGWNAGAEPRLTALAVLPAVAAAAVLLDAIATKLALRDVGVLVGFAALASLSHRFASIGPRRASEFAAVEAVAMVVVFALLVRLRGSVRSSPDVAG